MRSYVNYVQNEIKNLPSDVVDLFVDGLTTLLPRNRAMILEYSCMGDSDVARYCFKAHLFSRYIYFMLGKGYEFSYAFQFRFKQFILTQM